MKTRTSIWASLALPATAIGLFAQDNVTITRAIKASDEATLMAQGAVGIIGFSSQPDNVRFMTQEFTFGGRPVTNAPYSADEKTESIQTLADGTKITNVTSARIYRDSQGRTRREVSLPFGGAGEVHKMITITDPVANTNYNLDPDSKTAHLMPGFAMAARAVDFQTKSDAESKARAELEAHRVTAIAAPPPPMEYRVIRRTGAPSGKHEDLAPTMIEGVNVTGTRETNTIDVGAMGNDRPITISSERYYSPELQIEIKSVRNDPRMGQTTHTLTNISRVEPDASLFQVPSDYKLDEGKPGTAGRKFEFHTNQ